MFCLISLHPTDSALRDARTE